MTKYNEAIMVKVTAELLGCFDEVVKACKTTRSELIRDVLELFIERVKARKIDSNILPEAPKASEV